MASLKNESALCNLYCSPINVLIKEFVQCVDCEVKVKLVHYLERNTWRVNEVGWGKEEENLLTQYLSNLPKAH